MVTIDICYLDAPPKFDESKHPRGQPENKGEFAKSSGGGQNNPTTIVKAIAAGTNKIDKKGLGDKRKYSVSTAKLSVKEMETASKYIDSRMKGRSYSDPVYQGGDMMTEALKLLYAVARAPKDPDFTTKSSAVWLNNNIVALGVMQYSNKTASVVWLGTVVPGHGGAALRNLISQARADGMKKMTLFSTEMAVGFYEHIGFTSTGGNNMELKL
jgi:hypothetical protein